MTPEAQRIAIADACGWIKFWDQTGDEEYIGRWLWHRGQQNLKTPPDYLNDLNAMHEAEKVLIARGDDNHDGCGTPSFDYYRQKIGKCATAAQRAEAFLRTIGKWEESP